MHAVTVSRLSSIMISAQQHISALNIAQPADIEEYMQQLSLTPQMDVNGMQQNTSSPTEGRRKVIGRHPSNISGTQWPQQSLNYAAPNMLTQQHVLQMQQQQNMHRQHIPPQYQHLDYHSPRPIHPSNQHPHYGYSNYNTSVLPGSLNSNAKSPKPKVATTQMNRKKSETYPPRQSNSFTRSLSVGAEPNSYNWFQTQEATSYHPQETSRSSSHPCTSGIDVVEADGNQDLLSPDDGIDMSEQGLGLVGKSIMAPERLITKPLSTLDEESGSDTDFSDTHPNKFPIAIEEHGNRNCAYRRQPVRSGPQVKVIKKSGEAYSISSPTETPEVDQELMRRYYRKDLVRVCVCGRYDTKEPLLENRGRDNDADGYEVHYNIKCKWKSYEDFKTKKRVIIRLCKCYKPSF